MARLLLEQLGRQRVWTRRDAVQSRLGCRGGAEQVWAPAWGPGPGQECGESWAKGRRDSFSWRWHLKPRGDLQGKGHTLGSSHARLPGTHRALPTRGFGNPHRTHFPLCPEGLLGMACVLFFRLGSLEPLCFLEPGRGATALPSPTPLELYRLEWVTAPSPSLSCVTPCSDLTHPLPGC